MKIRSGFVSNSSSSSFIVINAKRGHDNYSVPPDEDMVFGNYGIKEFGWGPSTARDINSRINFAYLQTVYHPNENYLPMLESVIKEHVGCNKPITWKIGKNWEDENWGYIDHQSTYGNNIKMFDSEDMLKDFLFGVDSCIVIDNDNY